MKMAENQDLRQRNGEDSQNHHVAVSIGDQLPSYKSVTELVISEATEDPSHKKRQNEDVGLLYSISDVPPWYLCIFLGIQHYLTAFGSNLAVPLILAPAFCLGPTDVGTAQIFSTLIFVSGLVTVIQSTFGTRLPILQGGTFSFLAPTFAILSLPQWQCPSEPELNNISLGNETSLEEYKEELWQSRIREIQGAIIVASLFEVAIGFAGLLGIMLRYIGPLAIAPTIALVGMSLFGPAADACSGQWWIALSTIICIVVFSQFLSRCDIPCYAVRTTASGSKGCVRKTKMPFFRLFPMILSILLMWLICYILTATDALPNDRDKWGYEARTDARIAVLKKSQWFRFPYPFQWGLPTFSVAGVFGMLAGVIAGMLESLGDYYACARLSGAPPPPVHAINRGVMVEGFGCVLAGMWGTGNGTTSFSENVGAIGITRVGSRVVIQTGGLVMMVLGVLGKFGAIFVTIPQPIIGGVFMVTFGMIVSVGISNLQYCNLNSPRNLFIVGFAFFFGLSLPNWMASHPNVIQTGNVIANQIFTVLLSTSMFVGGTVGFILDNTIPGSEEERGIKSWRKHLDVEPTTDDSQRSDQQKKDVMRCYDLPWCMGCVKRVKCFRYLPFCPTFDFSPSCRCRHNRNDVTLENECTDVMTHHNVDKSDSNASFTVDQTHL